MIRSGRLSYSAIPLLVLCLSISPISCSRVKQRVCIRDGQRYCVTGDRIYVVTWDACYRRGVSCMEGGCWDQAIEEFRQAIGLRSEDQRFARAYGMHFREEYFPHRELGICFFRLGRLQEALEELELSLSQTPSARTKYYLNQVRRTSLLRTGEDRTPPLIRLENIPDDIPEEGLLVNRTPFQVMGTAQDDRYVAAIAVNGKPFFMELAEPSIPFAMPVELEDGWNTIRITALDLVDRQTELSIRLYLDRQGPMVIAHPDERGKIPGPDGLLLTAMVYDRSGIRSFHLDGREVRLLGVDQVSLVEEVLPFDPDRDEISFRAEDRAGNVTQGSIPLKSRREGIAMRLAWNGDGAGMLAMKTEEKGISFHMTHPPQEEMDTWYPEIFLEGRIETGNGIRGIELNDKGLFNVAEIQEAIERNIQDLRAMLARGNKDPETYIQLLREVSRRSRSYHINQKVPLPAEFTVLNLLVEDTMGNRESKIYHIRKIPREEVFRSEERMVLALLPPDVAAEAELGLQRYIFSRLLESFAQDGRFNLVEREKLPWVIMEKTVQSGGRVSESEVAQEIGEMVAAEGVICGYIQKRADGTEILARFVEVDTGLIRLFHDVFTPSVERENIDIITAGLAMKFRDSFPVCTGTVTGKEGRGIRVDIGSEKALFPGMMLNIFADERELIGKAHVRETHEGASEAELPEDGKVPDIEVGYRVRTR